MRRQLAATTSLALHAALLVGAALVVLPLRIDKARRDELEVELLEIPGQDTAEPAPQAEAAAAPAIDAAPPSVTQAVRTAGTPQAAPPEAQSEPDPLPPPPATIADPAPVVPLTTAYVPPRATAIAAVNPPLMGPSLTQVPHVALLPHELPRDPVVPPLNPAPETGTPAIMPRSLAPQPSQVTLLPLAPASTPVKPATQFNRAALGAQLQQSTPAKPTRGFDRTALGTAVQGARPRGAGRLSMRQKVDLAALIRRQITPCWNPPSMAENPGLVTVTLRIQLEPTGEVGAAPSVSGVTGAAAHNQAYVTALVGSVRRAVLRCAPLKLPADLYDAWSDVELNFDPRDVL